MNYDQKVVLSFNTPFPYDGKFYWLSNKEPQFEGVFNFVNRDIIGRLNVPQPVELFEAGQWTFDAFRNTAMAATLDTSGSGEIDQWGVSGNYLTIVRCLMASNNVTQFDFPNMRANVDDQPNMRVYEFVQNLFLDGHWYVGEGGLWDWDVNANFFTRGASALSAVEVWMLTHNQRRLTDIDYNIIGFPQGPDSGGANYVMYGDPTRGRTVMSVAVPNPEDVIMVWEEIQASFNFEYEELRVDGLRGWIALGVKYVECIDRITDLATNRIKVDFFTMFEDWPLSAIAARVIVDAFTPARAVETYRDMAQNEVWRMFDDPRFDPHYEVVWDDDEE
jgi:multiple sugar transport system substrate-binding protein